MRSVLGDVFVSRNLGSYNSVTFQRHNAGMDRIRCAGFVDGQLNQLCGEVTPQFTKHLWGGNRLTNMSVFFKISTTVGYPFIIRREVTCRCS